jgi:hypothetical protein
MKSVYSSLQNGRNRLLISLMGPLMYNWAIKGPINNESTKARASYPYHNHVHIIHITFRLGREVVFQCRDEGLLRARVRWIRGNGLSLPPGSRDINGRLEIPNIQLEHAGTYICEAVGYPSSTPGRQVTVVLSVEKCTCISIAFFCIFAH